MRRRNTATVQRSGAALRHHWEADAMMLLSQPPMMSASPAPYAARIALRRTTLTHSPGMHIAEPAEIAFQAMMPSEVSAAPVSPPRRERVMDRLRDAFRGDPSKASNAASGDEGDVCGTLAREQRADGSFDGDVRTTAAALVALVQAGHTRISGDRRRTVLKAAAWLRARSETAALAALRVLDTVENGASFPGIPPELGELGALGLAGRMLRRGASAAPPT